MLLTGPDPDKPEPIGPVSDFFGIWGVAVRPQGLPQGPGSRDQGRPGPRPQGPPAAGSTRADARANRTSPPRARSGEKELVHSSEFHPLGAL